MKIGGRLRRTYRQFPTTFWTLIGASFIDQLGGAILFPFFALYVTDHFGVGMTEVGILFGIFAIASVFGSMLGGALTDQLGRRWMLLFGLVASGLSSLLMGILNDLSLFYGLAVLVGLLTNSGGPARQAMVADLLPEAQHAEGYGISRVVANLATVIGPAIGGLLAARSFLTLFVLDAVLSVVTAVLVYALLPETKPAPHAEQPDETLGQTLRGYGRVLRDNLFLIFILASLLSALAYTQLNSTLSVYLRDEHGVPAQGFGTLLSINAALVVLLQFWVTRRVSNRPPMLMMVLGTLFYAVGFALFGFVETFLLFIAAIVIITIGEMITAPVAQALVARFAPEDMRGRYMAMYEFSWTIPFATGPLAAGLVLDAGFAEWVWYGAGLLALLAAGVYLALNLRVDQRLADQTPPRAAALPKA